MFHFGQYKIDMREVFFTSPLSYALVNQKPILPGHILVCPQRVVQRLRDLTSAEVSDLFQTVQKLSGVVERAYKGEAVTISLQDGPAAGQTVRHVHVHVIPRHSGDFERNDDIYPKVSHLKLSSGMRRALWRKKREYRVLFSYHSLLNAL